MPDDGEVPGSAVGAAGPRLTHLARHGCRQHDVGAGAPTTVEQDVATVQVTVIVIVPLLSTSGFVWPPAGHGRDTIDRSVGDRVVRIRTGEPLATASMSNDLSPSVADSGVHGGVGVSRAAQ